MASLDEDDIKISSGESSDSNNITVNIRPIELLYIFCDNLHDFEDEGSLTKEPARGIGLIALMVLKTYGNIVRDEEVIIEFIKEILNRTNGPIREKTYADGDTFEGLITNAKYPPGNRFIDMIVNTDKYQIPEMKGFLTADYGAQRLLYRKIFEWQNRFFVKNPSSIIVKDEEGLPEEQIEVEVVSPENYRDYESGENVDEISFMADGNWNTLLNSNTLRYDGTTIEGQIHFLEYQGEKDAYTIANSTKSIRDLLMEYKDQPDFTHLLIDKFASQYVGNVSKNYWFLPDAVLKASTTYSANFQDMSKYIKMGYGSSPIYQTIVGIPNHYDMASGTIVKAITPQVQQIQETTYGVGTTLDKQVEVSIGNDTEKKLTYTLEPLKADRFKNFSEAVMIIYEELLKWVNNKFRVQKIDAAHYQQFFASNDLNLNGFFQDFGKDLKEDEDKWFRRERASVDAQDLDRYKKLQKKQFVHHQLNIWGVSQNRQIDESGGGNTIDILTYQPPSSKQSISLVYQIKEFAASTHADTDPEFYREENHVILTGSKNWKQDPHFPSVSKTTGGKIGKQKYSNSFFKFKKIPTIVEDNEFKNYLIYLFLCDYTDDYDKEGVPVKSRDKIPTIRTSQIYHKWLVPYFSLSDPQDPKAIPVSQKIETTGIEDFGHTKVNSRIGPSVVQLEKRWRKLLLSLFLTFGGNNDEKKNQQVAAYIKWLEEKNKKRGEDGPTGKIKDFQNEMLSYLFTKPSFADTDIDMGNHALGDDDPDKYKSDEHKFIAKSWLEWTSEEGRKNDFVSFFGKILYLPIQSKLNSDWTQTLFTSYLNIHKSNYERGGYSRTTDGTHTLKKHNIFFPTSYDVFCTLGALISGTIMAENAGNRGVLMGTNFDPGIYDIINDDSHAAMKWMKSLEFSSTDKLEKFKMTMINFCSGIFEDYYSAYTNIIGKENLDANQIFILDFHNKISQKWSDEGYNWTVNLTLIFKLKKALFAFNEMDEGFLGKYTMTYTQMLSFIEQIERDIEYNKTIPSIQEENESIKFTIGLMNELIKMRQQLRTKLKHPVFITDQSKKIKAGAENSATSRDITQIDNLLKNLKRVLKRQKAFHFSYGHLKTVISGMKVAGIEERTWSKVNKYLFNRSGQKASFHWVRSNFPEKLESITLNENTPQIGTLTIMKENVPGQEATELDPRDLKGEKYTFRTPKEPEPSSPFEKLTKQQYQELVEESLDNRQLKPLLKKLSGRLDIVKIPRELQEAANQLTHQISEGRNEAFSDDYPRSPSRLKFSTGSPVQSRIKPAIVQRTNSETTTHLEYIEGGLGDLVTQGNATERVVEALAMEDVRMGDGSGPGDESGKIKELKDLLAGEKEEKKQFKDRFTRAMAEFRDLQKELDKLKGIHNTNKRKIEKTLVQVGKVKQGRTDGNNGDGKDGDRTTTTGGMKIKLKFNKTQKKKRKKGRKSQNKRKKKGRGSRKHGKRKHRNTRKKALKIEH